MRRVLSPAGLAPPAASYHHGLLVSGTREALYLSGQLGLAPDGSLAPDFAAQAEQAWANVHRLLDDAGLSVADIVKVTSYLVDRAHIPAYEAAHEAATGGHKPPWTLVLVAGLGSEEYLVEIDVTAVRA